MKTLNLTSLLTCVAILMLAKPQAWAADVPAGTTILIRTTKNITSDDPPGRPFEGIVVRDIAVVGRVVIPAGTPVRGVVKSPHFTVASTSRPLTLRLTALTRNGIMIGIETEDLECYSNSPRTIGPGRRVQVTGEEFTYDAGTFILFRLKQPVKV